MNAVLEKIHAVGTYTWVNFTSLPQNVLQASHSLNWHRKESHTIVVSNQFVKTVLIVICLDFFWVPSLYIFSMFSGCCFLGGGRILLVVRGCGIHANCKWLVLHRKWYSKTCTLVILGQDRWRLRMKRKEVEDEGSGMEHCENVHICMEHIHIEVIGSDDS